MSNAKLSVADSENLIKFRYRRSDNQPEGIFWESVIKELIKAERELLHSGEVKAIALDVGFCDLTFLPPAIGELQMLQMLSAYGNALTSEACSSLLRLTNIRELDLSDNEITTLPKEFSTLTALTFLDLAENPLEATALEQLADLRQLSFLNLGKTGLGMLPVSMRALKNLQILFLYRYNLSLQSLDDAIKWFPNLQEFSVGGNNLEMLPDAVTTMQKLTRLDLFGNCLSQESIEKISNLSSLQSLNLARNNLVTVSPTIKNLKKLTFLDLSDNPITDLEKIRIRSLLSNTEINFR